MEIVYEHQDVLCATQGPVFFLLWRRTPTVPQAQRVFELLEAAAKSVPRGIIFIVVTSNDVGQPNRETGQFFTRRTRVLEKQILAHAFVLEGAGFKNTMIRAAVHTMQSVSGVIFPWTIAPSVDEGIMFLVKKANVMSEPEARKLIDDITTLRATSG